MSNIVDITNDQIDDLLLAFGARMYDACDSEDPFGFSAGVIDRCAGLFGLDYNVMEIANPKGDLTPNYPNRILIPISEKKSPSNGSHNPSSDAPSSSSPPAQSPPPPAPQPPSIDAKRLRQHWKEARLARCRARFPVPVILYQDKFICRSATLSGYAEMYGRSTIETFMSLGMPPTDLKAKRAAAVVAAAEADADNAGNLDVDIDLEGDLEKNMTYIDATRANDIKLLKYLKVGVISDLMVEMKKVKYGLNVSSSEKVDKERRYARFHIAVMPYPGCEFFKCYRDNAHSPRRIFYKWEEQFNNADISISDIRAHSSFNNGVVPGTEAPDNGAPATVHGKYVPLDICWDEYRDWDLQKLTLNYLRSCLHNIRYSNSGMLVHCISGWDRTPLFVSMIRMTLWADGLIHKSLNAKQMMYLTIAYDWYLFGHNLPDRLYKGEDIFFFCFNMLKYMNVRELCMTSVPKPSRSKHNSGSSGGGSSSGRGGQGGAPSALGGNSKPDHMEYPIGAGGGMIFEQDEIDYEERSLNLLRYPEAGSSNNQRHGTNTHYDQRDRTYSGRSSTSEPALDGGSMESLFTDIQLDAANEPPRSRNDNVCSSPEDAGAVGGSSRPIAIGPARTSPMSMPRESRRRNESTSSGCGSWIQIGTTGSLMAEGTMQANMAQHAAASAAVGEAASPAAAAAAGSSNQPTAGDGVPPVFEDDEMYDIMLLRNNRLRQLREEFHQHYWQTIGRSKNQGPLGNLPP